MTPLRGVGPVIGSRADGGMSARFLSCFLRELGLVTSAGVAGTIDEDMARLWLSAVHASVRSVGGTVAGSVRPPGPGWNYYRVRVEGADGRVVRVCSTPVSASLAPRLMTACPRTGL